MAGGNDTTLYLPAPQLGEMLRRAPLGQRIVYATGPVLDPGNATVALVRDWAGRGEAVTNINGRDSEGRLRHVVARAQPVATKPRKGARAPASLSAEAAAQLVGETAAALLELLDRCAARGLPVPSYTVMAGELGLADRFAARRAMERLQDKGLITIERKGAGRAVRIVATGRATPLPAKRAPQEV